MEIFEYYEESIRQSFGDDVYQDMVNAAKGNLEDVIIPKCYIQFDNKVWKDNELYRARIKVCAVLPSTNYKIHYLLKWDRESSKPGGNHLGQMDKDLSGSFIDDRDAKGNLITNPDTDTADSFFSSNRHVFYFEDVIGQTDPSGVWTFKITINDETDSTVIAEKSTEIYWDILKERIK